MAEVVWRDERGRGLLRASTTEGQRSRPAAREKKGAQPPRRQRSPSAEHHPDAQAGRSATAARRRRGARLSSGGASPSLPARAPRPSPSGGPHHHRPGAHVPTSGAPRRAVIEKPRRRSTPRRGRGRAGRGGQAARVRVGQGRTG
eukprot:scaffold6227_cov417-Prasinococcus_capsulatus_cf.AAC.1